MKYWLETWVGTLAVVTLWLLVNAYLDEGFCRAIDCTARALHLYEY